MNKILLALFVISIIGACGKKVPVRPPDTKAGVTTNIEIDASISRL